MTSKYYYTDGVNVDVVYEMPLYFDTGVEMPKAIFNAMLGKSILAGEDKIKLERIDNEDISYMKSQGLKATQIPYSHILADAIKNNSVGIREDDYLVVSQ